MEFRSVCLTEGVGALIYAKSSQRYLFLLRSSGSWPLTWGLAGGKVDAGENAAQALMREIKEELGGSIVAPKFIPIEMFTSNNERFVYHTFFIAVDYEFIPELNNEHLGYAWLPLTAVPKPLHPGVYRTFNSDEVYRKIQIAQLNC
jgi:8-oxo-dGTP pyrophosphatase MutT (NUDIX family)